MFQRGSTSRVNSAVYTGLVVVSAEDCSSHAGGDDQRREDEHEQEYGTTCASLIRLLFSQGVDHEADQNGDRHRSTRQPDASDGDASAGTDRGLCLTPISFGSFFAHSFPIVEGLAHLSIRSYYYNVISMAFSQYPVKSCLL